MSENIDRILLKSRVDTSLKALEKYAERIGKVRNPTPGATREWSAQLLFLIEQHRLSVDQLTGAVRALSGRNRNLNQRITEMARTNLEKD